MNEPVLNHEDSPERKLWCAVLNDIVTSFKRRGYTEESFYYYLCSEDGQMVCDLASIDVNFLIRKILIEKVFIQNPLEEIEAN